jgi:hypothetical protein
MPPLYYLSVVLFVAVIANDWLLSRRVRKAVESQRLDCPDLEGVRFGGSPLGIALNLFRLRKIPATNDLSDPDHVAIRLHYRAHQVLVALLAACIAAGFLLRLAA